jgi:hypothetical protein
MSGGTGGNGSSATVGKDESNGHHVLDAPEKLEDAPKRLMRAVRGPFMRAKDWRSFAAVRFSCPVSAGDATTRVRKNARDFGYNYLCLAAILAAWNALMSPFAALMFVGAYVGHHYITRVRRAPIEIGGKTFSARTQSLAVTAALVVFFYKFVVDVFLGAAFVGAVFFAVHAVMRIPEPKSDEDEGEIPLLRDFVAAYRESEVSQYVPASVTSAVRGAFAFTKK